MKVLELFCGTKSFTKVAEARGHECRTLDNDPRFEPTYCMDIMEFEPSVLGGWMPDVIWASPPCECFSRASTGHAWRGIWHIRDKAYQPMNRKTGMAIENVLHTLGLIEKIAPRYWFIENPKANLRKMPFMPEDKRHEVWYCQYGDKRAKPTDIWSNLEGFTWRRCHNGANDHEEARRGAKTGTQGIKGAIDRARIPELFCLELVIACEGGMR